MEFDRLLAIKDSTNDNVVADLYIVPTVLDGTFSFGG